MRIPAGLAVLVMAGAMGCKSTPSVPADCICTASFALVQVEVVDTLGAPVSGLSPAITLVRTGEAIAPSGPSTGGGHYTVITDSERGRIASGGDTVRFTVTVGARSASGDFVIDVPGRCRCHIQKISGPDTLVLH